MWLIRLLGLCYQRQSYLDVGHSESYRQRRWAVQGQSALLGTIQRLRFVLWYLRVVPAGRLQRDLQRGRNLPFIRLLQRPRH